MEKISAQEALASYRMEKQSAWPVAVLAALRIAGPALLRRLGPQALKAILSRGAGGIARGAGKMFGRAGASVASKVPNTAALAKVPKISPTAGVKNTAGAAGKKGLLTRNNVMRAAEGATFLPMFGGSPKAPKNLSATIPGFDRYGRPSGSSINQTPGFYSTPTYK
jgi:type IV secretory pathway TrbL component